MKSRLRPAFDHPLFISGCKSMLIVTVPSGIRRLLSDAGGNISGDADMCSFLTLYAAALLTGKVFVNQLL